MTVGSPGLFDISTPIEGLIDADMKSFTVHEKLVDSAPKRVCCNVAPRRVVRTMVCDRWLSSVGALFKLVFGCLFDCNCLIFIYFLMCLGSGDGWSAFGVVRVTQSSGNDLLFIFKTIEIEDKTVDVSLRDVGVLRSGSTPTGAFVGHVHSRCMFCD